MNSSRAAAELPNGLRVRDFMHVSPHARAFNTWQIAFSGSDQLKQSGPPLVMEACRERFGVHTCDRGRSKAFVMSASPRGVVKEGFVDEDELWTTDVRETTAQVAATQHLRGILHRDQGRIIQTHGIDYAVSSDRSSLEYS
ncbi:hypothetical protein ONZ45_g11655 [Pleurotus djamor]|nr:hypothetical protein ONZ45_g11655 [Pleurotus djamor]